jgi:hypothetical protein
VDTIVALLAAFGDRDRTWVLDENGFRKIRQQQDIVVLHPTLCTYLSKMMMDGTSMRSLDQAGL